MTTNKKHIAISLGVSTLLIVLLVLYAEHKNYEPELLLSDDGTPEAIEGPLIPEEQKVMNAEITNTMNPIAHIHTNMGTIDLELFEDQMPITVGNFVTLAEDGFYNGTKFHRVIDGFMIQGGDPNTRGDDESIYGQGGSANIQDEFVDGELLTNTRGTIAMANTGQPNSGSSQFFINLGDNSPLDFNDNRQPKSSHPVFGRVIGGMGVVDAIAQVDTKPNAMGEISVPIAPVILESVEITREEPEGETDVEDSATTSENAVE